jgi:hypothetical protein
MLGQHQSLSSEPWLISSGLYGEEKRRVAVECLDRKRLVDSTWYPTVAALKPLTFLLSNVAQLGTGRH